MRYEFEAEVWLWPGEKAAWHFISLPQDLTAGIRTLSGPTRRGWGSVRVTATVGGSSWATSIFPSAQSGVFLLPVKAAVRKAEGIGAGDTVAVAVELSV